MSRILIAEDDRLQARIIGASLASRGYEVEIAENGMDAVQRLRTCHYDLALIDYRLPELDGLAVARLVRDLVPEGQRPRMIALTAAPRELGARELEVGSQAFDTVVPKPDVATTLMNVVESNMLLVAEQRRLADELLKSGLQREAQATRWRRLMAPLAALPALAMVGAFTAALLLVMSSAHYLTASIATVERTSTVTRDAGVVVDAVHDAETTGQSYTADRSPARREAFESSLQRVDSLLSSRASLNASGLPGFDASDDMLALVEQRMHALAATDLPAAASPEAAPPIAEAGGDITRTVQSWSARLIDVSLDAVAGTLQVIRLHSGFVMGVLAAGIVYGLFNAAQSILRRWRGVSPPLSSARPRALPAIRPRRLPAIASGD